MPLNNKKRVVITGIGVISPLGWVMETIWEKLDRRFSAIRKHDFPGRESLPHSACARIPDDSWLDLIPNRKAIKLMNRETQMAVAAAALALADARLDGGYAAERIGIYMGTGLTSGELAELLPLLEYSFDERGRFSCGRLGAEGLSHCNPLLSFKILTNMALCHVSMLFGIRGDNLIFNPWPGNTAQAVIAGARAIMWDEADCALVGGCDCKTHFIGFLTFSQLGLLSGSGWCRPFDQRGDGLILSEGAAILVLEDLEKALARNAYVYAEIAGSGEATDTASTVLYPEQPIPLKKAMDDALSEAGLTANKIDCICCSAGSHPVGDRHEAEAIADLFPRPPLISSLKPFCGDLLAAAPALALCTSAYAIKNRFLPPAVRPENPNPDIPLEFGDCRFQPEHLQSVMVNAFDLGSSKVSLVLRRLS